MVLDGPPPQTVTEFARISNADLVVADSRGAGNSNMVLRRRCQPRPESLLGPREGYERRVGA